MQPIVLLSKDKIVNNSSDRYSFKGAEGTCYWPRQQGRGLGQCGALNFLWRIGFHPKHIPIEQLPNPDNNGILFVDKYTSIDDNTCHALNKWMQQGGKIIATGELTTWQPFLPPKLNWQTCTFNNPYAALAYILEDYEPQLIAPPQWSFIKYNGTVQDSTHFIGKLAAVQGERQTPARAIFECHSNAPAIIRNNLFYYLNGQPFSAFQAWLQGQEDLSPWLNWRHRLFWLDEWVSFFYDYLIRHDVLDKTVTRPGIKHLNKTTVILRHDLDYSRDISFLSEENKRNISATHAVLKDKNTIFWTKQLKQFKKHEIAFHYNTGKRNWKNTIYNFLDKKNRTELMPHMRQITGNGLLKQIKWAKQHNIDVQTIHRHLCYLIYPEWIDAVDAVFESDIDVLGSNSLFRAHVLRWGTNEVEGNHGFLGEWPDAQFPSWYPFKLAHAGKGGKILKGWEMSALMDIEPDMLIQLIDHKIKHISQNIFSLIYHPAHANQSSLYQHGTYNYFKSILDILTERQIDVLPMCKVLQNTNKSLKE